MKNALLFVGAITVLFVVVAIVSLGSGDAEETARKVLASEGITDVQLTGHPWFACSDSETFSNGFTGKRNGNKIKGVVCAGVNKGATLRYLEVN